MEIQESWRTKVILGRPWQDWIFAASEVIFLITLIPLLFRVTNIPPFTGFGTAVMLYAIATCQYSYKNWMALGLGLFTATCWLLLGFGVHF